MNGDLISREELKNHKFVGNKFVQIGGRTNGKTLRAINQAYQQGWNDAIDAIIDNAPSVDIKEAYEQGYTDGWKERFGEPDGRPQGEWKLDSLGAYCSECGTHPDYSSNYCPNCGADMQKGGVV